jgi:hypothetical protein
LDEAKITVSKIKGMSTMALLTYGRDNNLSKKRGWLKDLLISEGMYIDYRIKMELDYRMSTIYN